MQSRQSPHFLTGKDSHYTFEKSESPFDINPEGTEVDGVNGRLVVQGTIEEKLADRIGVAMQEAGLQVIDKFAELRAIFAEYSPIAHDAVMKYSRIGVVGYEDLHASKAVIFVVGRSAYEVGIRVDMAAGRVELEGIAGDPQYFLHEEARSQILIDHADCDHNTYILSHPSRHIDFDDLSRHAIELIIDRCPGYRAAFDTKQAMDDAGAHQSLFGTKRPDKDLN